MLYKWIKPGYMCGQEYEMEDSVFVQKLVESGMLQKLEERWKPENKQYWFYLQLFGTEFDIKECPYGGNAAAVIGYWNTGNCFRTREEAEHAAKMTKELWLSLHNPCCENGNFGDGHNCLKENPTQKDGTYEKLYTSLGLPKWADAVKFLTELANTPEGHTTLAMPGRELQRNDLKETLEKLTPKGMKKTWVSDYFIQIMEKFDWKSVPEKPYVVTVSLQAECSPETTNKTFAEQKKIANKLGRMLNPLEYCVLQCVNAELGNKPLDVVGWTRFDAVSGGVVPVGCFYPGTARLGLYGDDAGGAYPKGGFRLERRVN